ncbi:glycosyltransferase family 2 protein [Flavobacterium caeni]|uniref:Glycosyltransferase involved in cell wall bisynthesis n=1 Tax=Flavobacterium caeni TaxID=490189 RepID=A0A1G5AWE2_9FLAO|nr:glycosyltransferase family 2 protein [Flavobacterium caeni]SCX82164.1 Glycosyltransferase involved in cell wall bisynthesis [Flavobacterium caeni]
MPKFSIITINYNDHEGLKKTIGSVIGQTFKDYEFLVIDGDSTDGSKHILSQNASRITYAVSEPDSGVYNAMNKGIRAAKGEFIIFMNSGDLFHDPEVLAKADALIDGQHDIYYGDVIVKKPNSERHKTYPNKLTFAYFYTNALCHQATFIRRQLFFDHFLYNEDYKIYSDGEFFLYTICKIGVPYKHIDLTVAIYDFTGISSNPKYEKLHEDERMASIEKFFPQFADDYKVLSKLNAKRTKQLFHIENYPMAWKLTKGFMSLVLLFLPKIKKS